MFDMYLLQYLYRAQGLLHCRRVAATSRIFNLISLQTKLDAVLFGIVWFLRVFSQDKLTSQPCCCRLVALTPNHLIPVPLKINVKGRPQR